MAQDIKTVMGTGNLGPYLVSALSKAGFKVTVLSRSSSKASSTIEDVPILLSDYTFESLISNFRGQDAIICATSATSIEDQRKIVDAAVAAKVQRILPNEFGSDTSTEVAKREVVEYIKQKETEGLSWTALCTGNWIDWILLEGTGLLGLDIRTKNGTLFDSGDIEFTTTTVAKVGEAVAAILLHPDETKDQYVYVDSFSVTQNLVLEALERVSGRKFIMDKMSVAEILTDGEKHLAEGDWDSAYYELVTAIQYSGHEAAHFPEKAKHWNKVLGLGQEETADEMIGRVLASVSACNEVN